MIDGPMVFVAALWILFIAGCIAVWRDKRKDNSPKWGQDKAGRR